MSRQKVELVTVPIHLGLNTETYSGMLLADGEYSTLNNMKPDMGAQVRRYAEAKLGADQTGTATGLSCKAFGGYNRIIRGYNNAGGVLEYYNYPGGAWTTIKSGLTDDSTVRWRNDRFLQCPVGSTAAEWLCFTNKVDEIQLWDGTLPAVTLSSKSSSIYRPYLAKDIVSYGGRLIAGNITQADAPAVWYPNRIRWSDGADFTKFSGDTTDTDYQWEDLVPRGSGGLQGFHVLNAGLYIFYADTVHRCMSSGDANYPFSFEYDILPVGCTDVNSIIEYRNHLIFKASDNTIRAFDGYKSYIFSDNTRSLLTPYEESSACLDPYFGNYVLKRPNVAGGLVCLNFGNPASSDIESLAYYTESHSNTIKFLSNLPTDSFASVQNGASFYVSHLNGSSTGQDFGTTDISFNMVGKEYYVGVNEEAFFEELIFFGSGSISVTAYFYPTGTTVTSTVNLNATGTRMNIGQWAASFQLYISQPGTPTDTVKIYKVLARIHNRRLQQGV